MRVAAVVGAREVREFAQLAAREVAVRHRDPEHRGVALDVQAILQPQRTELVVAQFAGKMAAHLVAKLHDAFVEKLLVIVVVSVHRVSLVEYLLQLSG